LAAGSRVILWRQGLATLNLPEKPLRVATRGAVTTWVKAHPTLTAACPPAVRSVLSAALRTGFAEWCGD